MIKIRNIFIVLIILIMNILPITTVHAASWLSDWAHRVVLVIDYSKVATNLTDFPIMVNLSTSSGITSTDISLIFDELGANKYKIAVTTSDGTTQCYVEIEQWDNANDLACLWVKVPTVTASTSTTLYLYYDSTKANNTTYIGVTTEAAAKSVWNSDYTAVYHFGETVNGTASEFKDSTANVLHGTAYRYNAGMAWPQRTTGIDGGYSLQFYNDNYYSSGWLHCIYIADNNAFSRSVANEELHISYWINPTTLSHHTYGTDYVRMLWKTSATTGLEWSHVFRATGGVTAYAWNDTTGKDYGLGVTPLIDDRPAGEWRFVNHALGYDAVPDDTWAKGGQKAWINAPSTWTYDIDWTDDQIEDGTYTKRFKTGTAAGYYMTNTDGTSPGYYPILNTTSPVLVGAGGYLAAQGYMYGFTGKIDELRFSAICRSEAWIIADYHSGEDNLISYTGIEDLATPPVPPVVLVSIDITPDTTTEIVGDQTQFIAIGTYSNNVTAAITTDVTWVSTYSSTIPVNTDGLASYLNVGSTQVTATLSGINSSPAILFATAPLVPLAPYAPSTTTGETLIGDVVPLMISISIAVIIIKSAFTNRKSIDIVKYIMAAAIGGAIVWYITSYVITELGF